jgi:hypothetical protein
LSDEREKLADELRRLKDAAREEARAGAREPVLPPAKPTRAPERLGVASPEPAPPAPPRPDGSAVNAAWPALPPHEPAGWRGGLARLLRRLLDPYVQAQVAFNSQQVQLDNAILAYLDARFAETHRHYDSVLGIHGRHMAEIDERHLILQEELVAHVHDLVKRIDLVLAESDKSRLSLEHALRDVSARLERLEERLGRR